MGRRKYSDKEYQDARRIVRARDKKCCRYCGSKENLHTHHIRPLSRGGNHKIYNLITLCKYCHQSEHEEIGIHGLGAIPGPEFENYREYLTDPDDTERYRKYLQSQGFEPRF
jgi:hypothetical protein